MKITKSKLKQIIKEELGEIPDKKAAMDELLTELFNVSKHAHELGQYKVRDHIYEAIAIIERNPRGE